MLFLQRGPGFTSYLSFWDENIFCTEENARHVTHAKVNTGLVWKFVFSWTENGRCFIVLSGRANILSYLSGKAIVK